MRSNCCCDSHSTTKRVSCKKGSISSAAQTRACSPPLLLLLWDVAGRGDGVIVLESMRIRRPHENGRAAFSDFSTLRHVFKKVRFQVLRFQDLYGRSAKTMQYVCVFEKKNVVVWAGPKPDDKPTIGRIMSFVEIIKLMRWGAAVFIRDVPIRSAVSGLGLI